VVWRFVVRLQGISGGVGRCQQHIANVDDKRDDHLYSVAPRVLVENVTVSKRGRPAGCAANQAKVPWTAQNLS
jgi:hypothetical protein